MGPPRLRERPGRPGGGIVPWPAVFDALVEAEGCVRLMLETYNTGPGDFGFSRGIFQTSALMQTVCTARDGFSPELLRPPR